MSTNQKVEVGPPTDAELADMVRMGKRKYITPEECQIAELAAEARRLRAEVSAMKAAREVAVRKFQGDEGFAAIWQLTEVRQENERLRAALDALNNSGTNIPEKVSDH